MTMNLGPLVVWSVLMVELLTYGAGQKICSCYEFISSPNTTFSWPQAHDSCLYNNKTLVVMETEEEWKFVKDQLQSRESAPANEWMIGLRRDLTTRNWTWVNGQPLTIDKWRKGKPDKSDIYALIAKQFPPGTEGLFNSINGNVRRGWICEEQSVNCTGTLCWPQFSQPTTTSVTSVSGRPTSSYVVKTMISSTSALPATTGFDKQTDNEGSALLAVIAAASVAGVLLILVIILAVVYLRRRGWPKKGAKRSKNTKSKNAAQTTENQQYDSIHATEAATLLGHAEDKTYAETRRKDKKEEPHVDCEYAMAENSHKKPQKSDLVYAELAGFDETNGDAQSLRPAPYEPTVYADLDQPQVVSGTVPNFKEPTYANVQSSAV